ncbi:MAG: hypothetical protein GY754_15305 [bacterium]|nr:hypothetical protein [bacterium]
MDYIILACGIFALCYGFYTVILRIANPGSFDKLESMQKTWGRIGGQMVHILSYSVAPIITGLTFIYLSLSGALVF